jgi:hypothetical protein
MNRANATLCIRSRTGRLRPAGCGQDRSQPDARQKTSMTGMSAKADMGGAPPKVTIAVTS